MRIAVALCMLLSFSPLCVGEEALETADIICAQENGARCFLCDGVKYHELERLLSVLPGRLKTQPEHRFLVAVAGDSVKPMELVSVIRIVRQQGWKHITVEFYEVRGSKKEPNCVRLSVDSPSSAELECPIASETSSSDEDADAD